MKSLGSGDSPDLSAGARAQRMRQSVGCTSMEALPQTSVGQCQATCPWPGADPTVKANSLRLRNKQGSTSWRLANYSTYKGPSTAQRRPSLNMAGQGLVCEDSGAPQTGPRCVDQLEAIYLESLPALSSGPRPDSRGHCRGDCSRAPRGRGEAAVPQDR